MSLSSNSIVHFTSSKDALKGILSDNFKIKYCREVLKFEGRSDIVLRVPMVSFCDIPLSQVKEHISRYGEYGLGLTREWAVRNRLNPVLYFEPGSHLAQSYSSAMTGLSKSRSAVDIEQAYGDLWDLARYMKPYEASLERKGDTVDRYRFSDEREWRYVPPKGSGCVSLFVDSQLGFEFDESSASKVDALRLQFEPNDIKYIIIKDDSEISEFISHLRGVKGGKYLFNDVDRLSSRILTTEQIRSDF